MTRSRRLTNVDFFVCISVAGMLVCASMESCATKPVTKPMRPSTTTALKNDAMIQIARQEAGTLRADLGAARAEAAKRSVEVDELRREVAQQRQRLSDLQQARDQQQYSSDKQQQEVATLKTERDRLLREKGELQREVAEIPGLKDALAASRASEGIAQARVKELEGSLASLRDVLDTIKEPVADRADQPSLSPNVQLDAVPDDKPRPAETGGHGEKGVRKEESPPRSAVQKAGEIATVFLTHIASPEPSWTWVTIKPRDTLWDLARLYGVTIGQLKTANGLSGDVIRVGQLLRIPSTKQE